MTTSARTILVTGGTGHVGTEVVKELLKRRAQVRVPVRTEDAPVPAGFLAAGDRVAERTRPPPTLTAAAIQERWKKAETLAAAYRTEVLQSGNPGG